MNKWTMDVNFRHDRLKKNHPTTFELRVANDKISKNFIKETITQFHSYVPSTVSVGRRIDWVVFNDDKPIGMIGIGSSVYPPPKDILTHTKLSMKEYKDNFNSFASNWRFCMREKIKNAGTQVLKELTFIDIGSATPIQYANCTSHLEANPDATIFFAIYLAI